MSEVGEVEIVDRDGNRHLVLACESGTRSTAEGRDLRSVASRLPTDRLRFWAARMLSCSGDHTILLEEIGQQLLFMEL